MMTNSQLGVYTTAPGVSPCHCPSPCPSTCHRLHTPWVTSVGTPPVLSRGLWPWSSRPWRAALISVRVRKGTNQAKYRTSHFSFSALLKAAVARNDEDRGGRAVLTLAGSQTHASRSRAHLAHRCPLILLQGTCSSHGTPGQEGAE